jgi:phage gp36-like protein
MWITPTIDGIGITANETAAIQNVAGAGFVSLQAKLTQVIAEVVGYVQAKNPVGPAGMIPGELETAAKAIAAYRFLSQTTSDKFITESRAKAFDSAMRQLRDVAQGLMKVAPPDTYAPVQSAPIVQTIQHGNHGNDRESLKGL